MFARALCDLLRKHVFVEKMVLFGRGGISESKNGDFES